MGLVLARKDVRANPHEGWFTMKLVNRNLNSQSNRVDRELVQDALLKGSAIGAGNEFWSRLVSDEMLYRAVLDFVMASDFTECSSFRRARDIMGDNFFGVSEALRYFGIHPLMTDLLSLTRIPFSEEELKNKRHSHVLSAVFPMSITSIRTRMKRVFNYSECAPWYLAQAFAKIPGESRWELVLKTPVQYSMRKTWDEQQALLTRNEETPNSRVLYYTMCGQFIARGERLLGEVTVRCSDVNPSGERVHVGRFGEHGPEIGLELDEHRVDYVGVASARKLI